MKKKWIVMLTIATMVLMWLPAGALASSTLEIGGGGYPFTETGLKNAIAAAESGDTIKFMIDGTIDMTNDIIIDQSITLDLNNHTVYFASSSGFDNLIIPSAASVSVTIQGPGMISTDTFIEVESSSMLTVQGNAVIEGTEVWQPLINDGAFSMTGGTLRQTNGNYVMLNSGSAILDYVTIESSTTSTLIWASAGTMLFDDCTIRNNYEGSSAWSNGSVFFMSGTSAVTLNGGSVTGPAGAAAPVVIAHVNTTFINNGAAITNGYVKKLGDLTVSVTPGPGLLTLAPQTAEPGVSYYYKSTAADDSTRKPAAYNTDFDLSGWTLFSAPADIPAAGRTTVYVQVVKVGNSENKIYGWGQSSAMPEATPRPARSPRPRQTPTPTPTAAPTPTATPAPTLAPAPTPTPAPTATPEATLAPAATPAPAETPAPAAAPTPSVTPSGTAENSTRTITGTLLDADGNPMAGYVVELHSDPMTAISDENGRYAFHDVAYTDHELFVKTPAGEQIAAFALSFAQGDRFDTDITGKGANITYTGDTATVDIVVTLKPDQSGAMISQVSDNPSSGSPSGGGTVFLWIGAGVLALAIIAVLVILLLRKRNGTT